MINAKIVGTGSYLPEKILTNQDLESMVDTTDEWIYSRTGIRERHIAAAEEKSSDLATNAAKKAIANAAIDVNDIDLIIVATTTPDKVFPSVATMVQRKLGITNHCPAFDVQAVCSGFVYGLTTANNFIKTGTSQCALVIGADTISKITDYSDRSNCILWGDGAGAVILKAAEEEGIISTHIHANGQHEEMLHVPRTESGSDTIAMEGNAVFKVAVNTLDQIVDETLAANDMQKSDIDWLVPHQAAASIPLALDTAVSDGRIKRGEVILMEAFGGGFTWGSVLLKY